MTCLFPYYLKQVSYSALPLMQNEKKNLLCKNRESLEMINLHSIVSNSVFQDIVDVEKNVGICLKFLISINSYL